MKGKFMNSATKFISVVALNITVLVGCGAKEVNQASAVKGGGTPTECFRLWLGSSSTGSRLVSSACLSEKKCKASAGLKNLALKKQGKTGMGYFCE